MQNNDMPNKTIHQGRNVKRFREMLGIKQEALAFDIGDDWSQKKISLLEAKETIEPALLQQISTALKIPVAAFENFDEEQAIVNIQNNYEGANSGNGTLSNNISYVACNINPLEKIIELHEQRIALYERMLKEKEDMMAELKKLMALK